MPSFANFMTPSCRNVTIGWLVVLALLSSVITIANCLVITVLSRDSFYHNTYGVYKFSLAIADLLVGAVVLPFLLAYKIRSFFFMKMPFRHIGEIPRSIDSTDQSILNLCGICTVFSIAVSIYTLTASSIDRYLAVKFPIKYKQRTRAVKIFTTVMLTMTWFSAILFSMVPLWSSNMQYGEVSGGLIVFAIPAEAGYDGYYDISEQLMVYMFYICLAGVPLLIVWTVNSLTMWEILDCCTPCHLDHISRRKGYLCLR